MQTKILLVEDEAITAMDIKRTLEMLSFEVVSIVGNGKDAIEKTGTLKPDLVLMDIVLKGEEDGIETAKIIKEQFDVPIIYLTAHSDEKTFERAKLTEPYGFIFKPFNYDGLKSTIETAIYKHGLEKKLKENEEKYRSLFENSLDAVLLTIPDGAILDVNLAAEKMFGYSREEIRKLGRNKLVDIKDPLLYTLLDERTRKGKAQGELTFIRKDGTKFPGEISSNIFKDMDGNEKTSMVIKDITQRKEAEEAVVFQAQLLSQTHEAIFSLDTNYIITYWNKAAEKIFGWKKEEVFGKNARELLKAKFKGFSSDEAISNLWIKGNWEGEVQHLRKNGTYSFADINATVLKNANGKEMGIVIVARDISKRKEAEEALHSESEFNAGVLETARAVIIILDKEGRIIGFNRYCEEISGYSFAEVKNRKVWDFLLIPEEVEAVKNVWNDLKADMSLDYFENYWKGKDGNLIRLAWSSTVISDSEGKPEYAIGIAMDITERNKLEEELRQARDNLELKVKERTAELQIERDKLNNILNTTKNGIYIVNNDYEIEYVNPVIEEDFGTFKNQKCHDYFYDNDIFCFNCKLEEAFKGKTVKNEIHSSNTGKDYDSVSMPIYNPNGARSVLTIMNDVTEYKRVQKENEKLIGDLQRSNNDLQQFAYVTSHDLQEPLRTIASFTQLLERRYKGQLDSDADEFMEYIVDAARRMQQLINDLLQYSRVTTKEEELQQVDTEEVLDNVLFNLKSSIEENNAEITHDPLPTVMADKTQLNQVFQNLIGNSIKFKKPDEPPRIHISVQKDNEKDEYVFSVSDNGIGMETQYAERIFTIFQRLHTQEVYKGTGIGLAIVKRIIESHGGRIWVESVLGEGSTFYFTIPVKE